MSSVSVVQEQVDIVLDAFSPLIVYDPPVDNITWSSNGGFGGDPLLADYSNSTYMFSDKANASATLNFTGTGVMIVGAYRSNDGPYMISIDGEEQFLNRTGPPPESDDQIFGYVMFDNRNSLDHGLHTIQLINEATEREVAQETGRVDVDYMTFSTVVPSIVSDTRIQDTDFAYNPVESWNTDNTNFPDFDQDTVHSTSFENATASLNFQGTRIIVYGAVGDAGSPYSVQIDDTVYPGYNGSRPGFGYRPGEILFYMDGLVNSSHSITLTALPDSGGVAINNTAFNTSSGSSTPEFFSIDYAIVDGYAVDVDAGSGSRSASSTGDHSALNKGDIAGIVIGSVVGLALICLGIVWMMSRRRRRGPRHPSSSFQGLLRQEKRPMTPATGTTLIQEPWRPEEVYPIIDIVQGGVASGSPSPPPVDEKAPRYSNEMSEEGYPAERERLKRAVAARESRTAEASAIDPLPIYEV